VQNVAPVQARQPDVFHPGSLEYLNKLKAALGNYMAKNGITLARLASILEIHESDINDWCRVRSWLPS
jgi:plasmid maintenance system antidote protein VapI